MGEQRLSQLGDESIAWSLFREVIDPYVIGQISMSGEPTSKARARFTNYGSQSKAYTPEKTREAEERVGWEFRRARPGWKVDADSQFGVFAVFFAGDYQRRDVDNMMKLVLDGLTGVIWKDDVQVAEISARVVRGDENPRTEIVVYRVWRVNPPPSKDCEQCSTQFPIHHSTSKRRFCSKSCEVAFRTASRTRTCEACGATFDGDKKRRYCSIACRSAGNRVDLACEQCGTGFTKPKSLMRNGRPFCSDKCRSAYWRAHRTAAARGVCSGCGGPTSKKTYSRCRACTTIREYVPKEET